MADPKDLREFTDQEITDEVTRRRALIDESKCTHCEEHWQNCRCYLSSDEGMVQNQPPERGQAMSQNFARMYGGSKSTRGRHGNCSSCGKPLNRGFKCGGKGKVCLTCA